jgi:hypothetical protein
MKADTVELLVAKAHFPTEQALAVAEAIDVAIHNSQLVTVPILEARFAAFGVEMNNRFAEVDARFAALVAEMNKRFAEVDVRFVALVAEMNRRFAEADMRFVTLEARIDQKFERFRLQIILAILAGYAAMGPVGAAVLDAIRRAL